MWNPSPDEGTISVIDSEVSVPVSTQPAQLPPPPPPKPTRSPVWKAVLAATLVGSLAGGGVGYVVAKNTDRGVSAGSSPSVTTLPGALATEPTVSAGGTPTGGALTGTPLSIRQLLEVAKPSVVSIETGVGSQGQPVGAGSGVIVSTDGLVITNNHVIADGDKYQVKLTDGRTFPAELVGNSPSDDLALLRITGGSNLSAAVLGNSDEIQVGDDVVAIGNALDLAGELTVTKGILSATNRSLPESNGTTIEGVLQTDAAINPGNSGGPLFDARGKVVGINTAISSSAQNIGFAIPSNRVSALIADLKKGGVSNPDAGYLGVSAIPVSQLTDAERSQFGVTSDSGVVITEVAPSSGAADAGLKVGDVLRKVGDTPIVSQGDLGLAVRSRKPGETVTITIERSGSEKVLTAVLGSRPAQ